MTWPTPQDYNEAIQNPIQSFADSDLQAATAETTSLGLPRPITGNFASVYHLRSARGEWAVRCFFREYGDMQERYAAISRHLQAAKLPYIVGFQYQEQGIRVRGAWFPILKMEWVEGELLSDWIEPRLGDAKALSALADRWLTMVRELERTSIEHGDLQHGNVMVVNGELRLVDYDCMFVPALAGRGSHEIGHQNYQHPRRSGTDFGPGLDRFSARVIYVSLRALARDAALWQACNAGDECLLFRRQDFDQPGASNAFRLLGEHVDADLRALCGQLVKALDAAPTSVAPMADSGADGAGLRRADDERRRWVSRMGRIVAPSHSASALLCEPVPSATVPEWLTGHLARPVSRHEFEPVGRTPAAVALAIGFAVAAAQDASLSRILPAPLAAGLSLATWLLVIVAACLVLYHRQPAVRRLKVVLREEARQRRRADRSRRFVDHLERRREAEMSRLTRRQQRDARARLRADQERKARDERIEATGGAALMACEARLAVLHDARRGETQSALEQWRATHVRRFLRSRSIRAAAIPQIGRIDKLRLWAGGARSAADLDRERITHLKFSDETKLLALVAWRVAMEQHARRSLPRALPASQLQRIARRYDPPIRRAELDRLSVEVIVETLSKASRRRLEVEMERIDVGAMRWEARYAQIVAAVDDEVVEARQAHDLERARLARAAETLRPFDGICLSHFLVESLSDLRERRGRSTTAPAGPKVTGS